MPVGAILDVKIMKGKTQNTIKNYKTSMKICSKKAKKPVVKNETTAESFFSILIRVDLFIMRISCGQNKDKKLANFKTSLIFFIQKHSN